MVVDHIAAPVLFPKKHALVISDGLGKGFVGDGSICETGGIKSRHVMPVSSEAVSSTVSFGLTTNPQTQRTGVPDSAQLRTVLWNQLNDRNKVSRNLLRDEDVRTVEDEGRQFVLVSVPRASRQQRPVHVGPNPMTGTFRRAEEGDYGLDSLSVMRQWYCGQINIETAHLTMKKLSQK